MPAKKIELNKQFVKALELMEKTGRNIFITGRAGTGKSTLLELFRAQTKKKIAVLAPTGVAALNVSGQTIHSFFRFKTDITLKRVKKARPDSDMAKLYTGLDAIVIDEISMVRADLFDCIDKFMRLNGKTDKLPFGGAQMIFFGDLYQLPPVVTSAEREIFRTHYASPYFFSAQVVKNGFNFEYLELEKIYRQSDERFISALNAIRNNSMSAEDLEFINTRLAPDFVPPENDFFITLTATNDLAARINRDKLNELRGKEFRNEAYVAGDFEERSLPAEKVLEIKPGAQVMFLNNDREGRWVNGTVGVVKEIKKTEYGWKLIVSVGRENYEVDQHTWETHEYYFNKENKSIDTKKKGSFTQYPVRLAWAITIHKSQGKTFERVIIDLNRATFAAGQMYVALSRATKLESIILKKPVLAGHVRIDWQIVRFVTACQYAKSEEELSLEEKVCLLKSAVKEKRTIKIIYLKASDIKTARSIIPKKVGEFEYLNKKFLGVSARCLERNEDRIFRVDRILKME